MEGEIFYRVIYGDTDCGGVMYYANYLRLFEMGRTELIRACGLSYKEIEEEMGIILPVVEVKARYKASAKYDDLLRIRTTLVEARSFKILFAYQIFREEILLVEGSTLHVAINRIGKIVKIPEKILKLLSG
ncbi:thioesterase [Caldimicrobium thiodismutans]|jgi:acyl-CoA thioester hydrolase|uniref:Thioesterase n=1 Tax=Caldimicrobium thiodismutans TaxID=1653476 RepID=A0A0U4W2H2_9BACT|nr:thioesterase family protein [Caldimicrobium thiodismutans]BAU23274.1 thioesterase [Caldimicrobium thiodismutans]